MEEVTAIRVHHVAARSLVLTLSGVVDASCAGRLADQFARRLVTARGVGYKLMPV